MALTMIPATSNRPTSWTGLSSDAKPTGAEVEPGALIFYTDTPAIAEFDGLNWTVISTGGGAHVYALARNMIRQAAGAYSATAVLGFLVEAAPTADDTSITPVDGSATANINKEAFTEGQVYPIHASAITVGTGGEFLLFIP